MPKQSPKRPPGFYEAALREWRVDGLQRGLTDEETILLSAQFCGLAVAKSDLSPDGQTAMLDLASRAMQTAYAGRMAVKAGLGRGRRLGRDSDRPA